MSRAFDFAQAFDFPLAFDLPLVFCLGASSATGNIGLGNSVMGGMSSDGKDFAGG